MSNSRAKQSRSRKAKKAGRRYEVRFFYSQYSTATKLITATSLAEAERKADEMDAGGISEFDPVDGELWVESVELAEEGKSHE